MVFDPKTVDINSPIDGTVQPTAAVQPDPTTKGLGVTVLSARNLSVQGIAVPIRVFLLYVAPPKNSGFIDPSVGPTPPILIAYGIEVDPSATDVETVTYSKKVVTPYYCQVYESSLDVIYHVRTVTPLS
jgi:hypothetical protein